MDAVPATEEYDPTQPAMFLNPQIGDGSIEKVTTSSSYPATSFKKAIKLLEEKQKNAGDMYKEAQKAARLQYDRKRLHPDDMQNTMSKRSRAKGVNINSSSGGGIKKKIEKAVIRSVVRPIPLKPKKVSISKRASINFSLCNHCMMRTQAKTAIMHGYDGTAYITVVLCPSCIDFNSKAGIID